MIDFWTHTGAVLAGGRSARMGRPKEDLILPDGRGMAETVADALASMVGVVVVLGQTGVLGDHQHLPDLRPDQGPLGGIEALLASGLDTEYLVVPCDLPLITPEVLHLHTRGGAGDDQDAGAAATVLRVEGEDDPRPLPARISAAALPIVREQLDAGRRSVRGLLARIEVEVVDVPAALAAQLENVNTPEDLARVWIAADE